MLGLCRCEGPSLPWPLPLGLLGSRAQTQLWCTGPVAPSGTWDLPRPGIEPMSPSLAHHWATREGFAKGFTLGSDSFDSAEALCVSNQNIFLFWSRNCHALRCRVGFSAAQTSHLGNTCQVFLPSVLESLS